MYFNPNYGIIDEKSLGWSEPNFVRSVYGISGGSSGRGLEALYRVQDPLEQSGNLGYATSPQGGEFVQTSCFSPSEQRPLLFHLGTGDELLTNVHSLSGQLGDYSSSSTR